MWLNASLRLYNAYIYYQVVHLLKSICSCYVADKVESILIPSWRLNYILTWLYLIPSLMTEIKTEKRIFDAEEIGGK